MYLLIRPLGSVAFRWGGLSSILLSGPMSSGFFEPLPLPSTIYGALKFAYIMNKLGDEPPAFKGPMLYAEGTEKRLLCIHSYSLGLKCNINGQFEDCGKIVNVSDDFFEKRIGIALERNKKSAKTGYIYMEKMLDIFRLTSSILGEAPKSYGILIEINDQNAKKLDGFVLPFGGESRVAKISYMEDVDIKRVGREFLASPAIIDDGDENQIIWENRRASIISSANKVTYRLLSLGFEINRRLPIRLALMPGIEIYNDYGYVGYFNDRGWGSVVEI